MLKHELQHFTFPKEGPDHNAAAASRQFNILIAAPLRGDSWH
jgi:hypothetical protein